MVDLKVGAIVQSKNVTVSSDSSQKVSFTFRMKKGVTALSVLLGFHSEKEPFTAKDEDRAFRVLGYIGYVDLLQYLSKDEVLKIERAERKKFGL